MACAWDLPMRWLRGWEIFATWTCCQPPPFWTCRLIYHLRKLPRGLGIRFVVHGAIQSSKGQWHLSLEMFDAHLQAACLSRKCELDMDRLSDIESDIARQIAGALNRPLGACAGATASAIQP